MSMFSVRCYLQNNVFFWLEVILDAPNVSLSVSHAEHLQEVEESLVALLLSPRLQELARWVVYYFLLQSHVLNKFELALNPNLIFSAGKAHLGARVGNKLAVKILCRSGVEHNSAVVCLVHQNAAHAWLTVVVGCNVHYRMCVQHL